MRAAAAARRFSILLAGVPPAYILWFVSRYGLDIPVWEEWQFIPQWDRFLSGGAWVRGLLDSYFSHRPVLPALILLLVGRVTGFASWPGLALVWLSTLALLFIYGYWLRRARAGSVWLLPALSLTLFTSHHAEIFLDGWDFQLPLVLVEVAGVLTLLTAERLTLKALAGAAALSLAAAFTWGSGVLVVVAACAVLLLRRPRPAPRILLLWGICSAGVFGLYLSVSEPVPGTAGLLLERRFWESLSWLMANSGCLVSRIWAGTVPIGLSLLWCFFLMREHRGAHDNRLLAWAGMSLFLAMTTLLIVLIRITPAPQNAMLPRYALFTSQLMATLATGAILAVGNSWLRWLLTASYLAFLMLVLNGDGQFQRRTDEGDPPRAGLQAFANSFPMHLTVGQFLWVVEFDEERVRNGLAIMRRHGVGLFRPAKLLAARPYPSIRPEAEALRWNLRGVRRLSSGGLQLEGWAFDLKTAAPLPIVFLSAGGRMVEHGLTGFWSDDFTAAGVKERARFCGWSLVVPPAASATLPNTVELHFVAEDGRSAVAIVNIDQAVDLTEPGSSGRKDSR